MQNIELAVVSQRVDFAPREAIAKDLTVLRSSSARKLFASRVVVQQNANVLDGPRQEPARALVGAGRYSRPAGSQNAPSY